MNIGRLDKRINLQQYVEVSGKEAWVTRFTVWAQIKNPDMKTVEVAGNLASEFTREINIRYNPAIRKGWRALWETRVFDITQEPYDYRKATTVLICRELTL